MKIQVSIEDIVNTASALQQMSVSYEESTTRILNQMNEVQGVWQGTDSQAFLESAAALRPKLAQLKQVIDSYAQILSSSAAAYQDLQASRTANARLL